MHILHLAWEFPPHLVGGMGRHVADLVPELALRGTRITIISPLLRGGSLLEERWPGVRVRRVPTPRMEEYDFTTFVAHSNTACERAAQSLFAQSERPDIIHTHDWLGSLMGISLKQHWRVPLIATIHATERGRGRGYLNGAISHQINDLEWRLTYEAWRVIVCSHFMAQQIRDYFTTPADKIDVIPNGVRPQSNPFSSPFERMRFRQRFVGDDEQLVFYVGRIVYEKGLQVLLDAWPTIRAHSRARLVIAGDGPYLDALKAQAQALNLDGRVLFTGFISDADRERLYHAADVAVFPSLYEPFGIVALEAFAAHCPVVAAATGGLAEVVEPGHSGLLAPPGDVDGLAHALLTTLTDPHAAHLRARRAFEQVQNRYTWEHIADATLAVYRRVYAEWSSGSWGRELIRVEPEHLDRNEQNDGRK
jgi:glycosyltransferase involved in cell wall biosynthesis